MHAKWTNKNKRNLAKFKPELKTSNYVMSLLLICRERPFALVI